MPWASRRAERLASRRAGNLRDTPPRGAAARRRRRHGLADHRRGAAPALARGGEPARARGRRLAAPQLHQRGRRGDRDEHVRREPAQARGALPRRRARARSTRSASSSRATRASVSGRDVFIAGAIGPIGEAMTSARRHELFAEQAAVLEGRGADLFMLETFYDLDELVDAIAALRERLAAADRRAAHLRRGRRDARGRRARARRPTGSTELDLAAFGANHGAGLLAALEALEQMQGDGRALAALPNIGLASLSGGRVIYPHATPDYFAEFAAHARDLGARLIGGCCGTTPTEIAAISAAIAENRQARSRLEVNERDVRRLARRGAARDRVQPRAARGRVRRLGAARPAARRLEPRTARDGRRARGLGRHPLRRRERQRDRARRA